MPLRLPLLLCFRRAGRGAGSLRRRCGEHPHRTISPAAFPTAPPTTRPGSRRCFFVYGEYGTADAAPAVVRKEPQLSDAPVTVPLIAAENVEKRYGAFRPALVGVDLSVGRGDFLVIEGPGGCGKSVLLRLLSGMEPVSGGSIRIAGEDLAGMRPRALAHLRRSLGIVPPGGGLLERAGAVANVELAARVAGTPPDEARRRAHAALERVGVDPERDGATACAHLAAGQRQCVALARALVNAPALLLLDDLLEPLDDVAAVRVVGILARFADAGVAIVATARTAAAYASPAGVPAGTADPSLGASSVPSSAASAAAAAPAPWPARLRRLKLGAAGAPATGSA